MLSLTAVGVLLAGEEAGSAAKPMVEDTEWDGITAELLSVERTSGNMLTIKFKYTNTGSAKADISKLGQFSHDNVVEHVYYVDTQSKKKIPGGQGCRGQGVREQPEVF
jgi:hypothetical protein